MLSLKTTEINNIIQTSLQNIKSHYRSLNGKNGWHQYLGNEKVGNIATSQALILLNTFNEDFDKKHLAFEFIINSQIKSDNNKQSDGGWTYVTNFSDIPTTEATCWSLLALYENYRNSETAKTGIQWLLNNHITSNNDEGWGTIKSDISRVYTTCLALRVLQMYKFNNTLQFEKASNWLIKSQNEDFGWGERFGHLSTITHTSHAILTISKIQNINSQCISNGVKWLLNNFKTIDAKIWNDKSGYQEMIEFDYEYNGKLNHHRLVYYHMPIPYALMALIKTGNIHRKIVFEGLNELVKNNNNGYWNHPYFESIKVKPLWSIYDTLISFKTLIEYCSDWNQILEIQLRRNKLTFVKNLNPFNFSNFTNNFILGIWGKVFAIIIACIFIIGVSKLFPDWSKTTYTSIILFPLIVEVLGYYLTEVRQRK